MNKVKLFLTLVAALVVGASVAYAVSAPADTNAQQACPSGSAWVKWGLVSTSEYYNIYYREASDPSWSHSVPRIDPFTLSYHLRCLKPGVKYFYAVGVVNLNGHETFIVPETALWPNGYVPTPYYVPTSGVGYGRG